MDRTSTLPPALTAWILGAECLATHPGAADLPGGNSVPLLRSDNGWTIELYRDPGTDFRASRSGWLVGPVGWPLGTLPTAPVYRHDAGIRGNPLGRRDRITVRIDPAPDGGCAVVVVTRGDVGTGLVDRMRGVLHQAELLQTCHQLAAAEAWHAVRSSSWTVRTMAGGCSVPLSRWLLRSAWQLELHAAHRLGDVVGEERARSNLGREAGPPPGGATPRSRLMAGMRRPAAPPPVGVTDPAVGATLRAAVDRMLDAEQVDGAELRLNRALRGGIQLPGDAVRLCRVAGQRNTPWLAAGWSWLAALSAGDPVRRAGLEDQARKRVAAAGEPRLARLLTWQDPTAAPAPDGRGGDPGTIAAARARYLLMTGQDEPARRAIAQALELGGIQLHQALMLLEIQDAKRDRRLRRELAQSGPAAHTFWIRTSPDAWTGGHPGFAAAPGVAPMR